MPNNSAIIPIDRIAQSILLIRGEKVMLDVDLAYLFGVTTKQLNQQVKRNRSRFPEDFMFQLTEVEKEKVVTNCDHLRNKLKYSPHLPYAFSEHGALMLANVIKSEVAIEASIQIVRTFIKLRKLLETKKELSRKMRELESKYDNQFAIVFEYLKELMTPPEKPQKPIGFIHQ